MPRLVKIVRELYRVEFDSGRIDDWCVYLHRPFQLRTAPKDLEYFQFFLQLGKTYGLEKVYADFLQIYEPTNHLVDSTILTNITAIADRYDEYATDVDIWFTVIYAGMIAEENKANAVLKKRVKRLAMHQILMEGMDPTVAVEFSKGKKWRELDSLMREKGF